MFVHPLVGQSFSTTSGGPAECQALCRALDIPNLTSVKIKNCPCGAYSLLWGQVLIKNTQINVKWPLCQEEVHGGAQEVGSSLLRWRYRFRDLKTEN